MNRQNRKDIRISSHPLILKVNQAFERFLRLIAYQPKEKKILECPELNIIIYQTFDSKNELEKHLINYFIYMLNCKKGLSIQTSLYWLYRSALRALTYRANGGLQSITYENFDRAIFQIIEVLEPVSFSQRYSCEEYLNAVCFAKRCNDNYPKSELVSFTDFCFMKIIIEIKTWNNPPLFSDFFRFIGNVFISELTLFHPISKYYPISH